MARGLHSSVEQSCWCQVWSMSNRLQRTAVKIVAGDLRLVSNAALIKTAQRIGLVLGVKADVCQTYMYALDDNLRSSRQSTEYIVAHFYKALCN